jgi:DNA gyrase subunit A
MTELRYQTVEMRPTYDAADEEPVVVPARYPALLVNGSSGIAVGMATNMPPHNLGEVIKACVHLIENPDASVAQLMRYIKGPDFPLGGRIVTDRAALKDMYETGEVPSKFAVNGDLISRAKSKIPVESSFIHDSVRCDDRTADGGNR